MHAHSMHNSFAGGCGLVQPTRETAELSCVAEAGPCACLVRAPLLCVCMSVHVSSSSLDLPVSARVRYTEDHKPQNPSERDRIREAGGDVVVMGEVARVTTVAGATAAASGSDVS